MFTLCCKLFLACSLFKVFSPLVHTYFDDYYRAYLVLAFSVIVHIILRAQIEDEKN